jgi:hypothetical protein
MPASSHARRCRPPDRELRALQAHVAALPVGTSGTLPFPKDGMLAIIRTVIAVEVERARRPQQRARPTALT